MELTVDGRAGILRLRIIVVGVAASIVAVAAGDVFDQRQWWLLVSPAVVTLAALPLRRFSGLVRLLAAIAVVAVATAAATLALGGDVGDVGTASTDGLRRLLSTEWPSPARPDLLATAALFLAIGTAFATELAGRPRLHLAPLVPIGLLQLGVIATSSPLGVRFGWRTRI